MLVGRGGQVRCAQRRAHRANYLYNQHSCVRSIVTAQWLFNDKSVSAASNRLIQPTKDTYPSLKRGDYATLTADDIEKFRSIISSNNRIIDRSHSSEDELLPFNTDWMNKYRGQSSLVLKPKSTKEVSEILRYCSERRLAVVPQGGNTGLVGGSVPVFDEIIINMSIMNKIRSFDRVSGSLVCDAGCILETVDAYLADHHHIFPLDLGAKGSCHVGGNVATNAGGLRLLRYGNLHGSILGLEVVLPDGTIVDALSTLRKDNTGYDYKHLFIGSEGTIGIITGISILCPRRPNARNIAILGLSSYENVQATFSEAKAALSEILSAFEFMDAAAYRFTVGHSGAKRPLEGEHQFYVIIESSGSNKEHDEQKLSAFLESVLDKEIIEDGVLAQDETQASRIWALREGIPESLNKSGGAYKYDVSIPLKELYQCVVDVKSHLTTSNVVSQTDESKPVLDVVGYGHLGDGNLHLNIPVRGYSKEVENLLEPFVFQWIKERRGSISAEHGLGLSKKQFIDYSRDETSINIMRKIKRLFDPAAIMNPYKYI